MRIDAVSSTAAITSLLNQSKAAQSQAEQFTLATEPVQAIEQPEKKTATSVSENLYVKAAKGSPDRAEEVAHNLTFTSMNMELVDISSWPVVRYSVSGQVVTEESKAYFQETSAAALKQRIDIYHSEKANGTSTLDLIDKLIAFNNSQPKDFQDMANWHV